MNPTPLLILLLSCCLHAPEAQRRAPWARSNEEINRAREQTGSPHPPSPRSQPRGTSTSALETVTSTEQILSELLSTRRRRLPSVPRRDSDSQKPEEPVDHSTRRKKLIRVRPLRDETSGPQQLQTIEEDSGKKKNDEKVLQFPQGSPIPFSTLPPRSNEITPSVGSGIDDILPSIAENSLEMTTEFNKNHLSNIGKQGSPYQLLQVFRPPSEAGLPQPVPLDEIHQLNGLHPEEVFLKDGDLIVIKGNGFPKSYAQSLADLMIDNYIALPREPKLPPPGLEFGGPGGIYGDPFEGLDLECIEKGICPPPGLLPFGLPFNASSDDGGIPLGPFFGVSLSDPRQKPPPFDPSRYEVVEVPFFDEPPPPPPRPTPPSLADEDYDEGVTRKPTIEERYKEYQVIHVPPPPRRRGPTDGFTGPPQGDSRIRLPMESLPSPRQDPRSQFSGFGQPGIQFPSQPLPGQQQQHPFIAELERTAPGKRSRPGPAAEVALRFPGDLNGEDLVPFRRTEEPPRRKIQTTPGPSVTHTATNLVEDEEVPTSTRVPGILRKRQKLQSLDDVPPRPREPQIPKEHEDKFWTGLSRDEVEGGFEFGDRIHQRRKGQPPTNPNPQASGNVRFPEFRPTPIEDGIRFVTTANPVPQALKESDQAEDAFRRQQPRIRGGVGPSVTTPPGTPSRQTRPTTPFEEFPSVAVATREGEKRVLQGTRFREPLQHSNLVGGGVRPGHSLHTDINVNFQQPLPQTNPHAEFLPQFFPDSSRLYSRPQHTPNPGSSGYNGFNPFNQVPASGFGQPILFQRRPEISSSFPFFTSLAQLNQRQQQSPPNQQNPKRNGFVRYTFVMGGNEQHPLVQYSYPVQI